VSLPDGATLRTLFQQEPERINLTLDEPITLRGGEPNTVSVSATTISFVPGLDESGFSSSTRDVSAFHDESPSVVPIDPDGFYGDEIQAEKPGVDSGLPKDVEEALEIRKTVDEDSLGEFEEKAYRLKNSLDIEYSVTDDGRVDVTEPIKISVNFKSPVNNNLLSQPYSVEVSVDNEELPNTVLHDVAREEYNTLLDRDGDGAIERDAEAIIRIFAGEVEEQKRKPFTYDRYLDADITELKNPLGEEMEALRVSTIWGAVNNITRELIDRAIAGSGDEGGESDLPGVPDNPHVYTWIDVALLADGTVYVRVPDASVFPRHSLYVNGEKERTNSFTVSAQSGPNEYGAEYFEEGNSVWERFKKEAKGGSVVPFRSPHNVYVNEYDHGSEPDFFPGHPVMVYGVDSDGDEIEPDVVEERLGEPNDPFPTGQL